MVRRGSRNGAQLLELGKAAGQRTAGPSRPTKCRNGAQLLELGKVHPLAAAEAPEECRNGAQLLELGKDLGSDIGIDGLHHVAMEPSF